MPPTGFERTIPTSGRLQTHALDRAATWRDALRIYIQFSTAYSGYHHSQIYKVKTRCEQVRWGKVCLIPN